MIYKKKYKLNNNNNCYDGRNNVDEFNNKKRTGLCNPRRRASGSYRFIVTYLQYNNK